MHSNHKKPFLDIYSHISEYANVTPFPDFPPFCASPQLWLNQAVVYIFMFILQSTQSFNQFCCSSKFPSDWQCVSCFMMAKIDLTFPEGFTEVPLEERRF